MACCRAAPDSILLLIHCLFYDVIYRIANRRTGEFAHDFASLSYSSLCAINIQILNCTESIVEQTVVENGALDKRGIDNGSGANTRQKRYRQPSYLAFRLSCHPFTSALQQFSPLRIHHPPQPLPSPDFHRHHCFVVLIMPTTFKDLLDETAAILGPNAVWNHSPP